MTHDYHPGLPGYNEKQILHDGCEECEHRGSDPYRALNALDSEQFIRAWRRAIDFERGASGLAISSAEAPLLRSMYAFHIRLTRSPEILNLILIEGELEML